MESFRHNFCRFLFMGFFLLLVHCVALSYSASEDVFIWNRTIINEDNRVISIAGPATRRISMYQNFTFTCRTQGLVVWSINEVDILNPEQVDSDKKFGVFLQIPMPKESSISINARRNNDQLAVQCHQLKNSRDYIVASSDIITISLESGTVRCSRFTFPPNSDVRIQGRNVGDYARYTCEKGFVLMGQPIRMCGEDGQWSGVDPKCVSKSVRNSITKYALLLASIISLYCLNQFNDN